MNELTNQSEAVGKMNRKTDLSNYEEELAKASYVKASCAPKVVDVLSFPERFGIGPSLLNAFTADGFLDEPSEEFSCLVQSSKQTVVKSSSYFDTYYLHAGMQRVNISNLESNINISRISFNLEFSSRVLNLFLQASEPDCSDQTPSKSKLGALRADASDRVGRVLPELPRALQEAFAREIDLFFH